MSQSVEERIERVVNHLLPETAFEGHFGPPQPLHARMARFHTPGACIAVIEDGEVEWARGFGMCDMGSSRPVMPETLFQAGSISKPVFALGVMRLVEQGRLDLDEDVNTYLTSWRVPANGDWQPRITLRQLLSHTAGLTVHGFPGYQASEAIPTTVQVLNGEPPANTDPVKVNILPGMQFRYSGGGTTVGQQVLVDVLKQPFPAIMRSLVLDPLGLAASTYEQPLPADWAARAATAHPWKGIPLKGRYHIYPEMAAAGLWTTAADLASIGVELLRTLRGNAPRLLKPQIVEAMLRPQLPRQPPGQKNGEEEYVGLGWFCRASGESFHFGHGGWDEGFLANIRIYPRLGRGAVVMINSNEGHPLLDEVIRAVAWEYGWPGVFDQKSAADIARPEAFAGVYQSQTGMRFDVIPRGEGLLLQFAGQSPLPLFARSEKEFFAGAVNTSVQFETDAGGNVFALTLSQAGAQVRALKQ